MDRWYVQRQLMTLAADTNNIIQIRKQTTNNTILVGYTAGATVKGPTTTLTSTTWVQVGVTWSKTADQVGMYVNGRQIGSFLTGLGTWVGNLATTSGPIGASSSAGAAPWSGRINDVRLYSRALSAPEILREYRKYLPQFQQQLWR
jgi:hypothetical protein